MKRRKILIGITVLIFLMVLVRIISNTQYREQIPNPSGESQCAVYYLLNIDGMKGLGHSALMLTDEQGNGLLYSYNGMQYSLTECLMGKAGIGKMKCFELKSEEVDDFLLTGNLQVSDASECDNFDRLLYTYISDEEYNCIKAEADAYISVGDTFEDLYAKAFHAQGEEKQAAEEELQKYVTREDVPKYQIYTYNCDTVARKTIAIVSEEMKRYNEENVKLIPSANYKNMSKHLGEKFGVLNMGEDSLCEKLLWYFL